MIIDGIALKFETQKVLRMIAAQASQVSGIPVPALQGPSRRWEVSLMRLYFIALCVEHGFRKGDIAEFLDRDHSTVWAIYQRFSESMADFSWVRKSYEQFRESINALGTSKKVG
jgi:chromosomal replication initiation ATPase DnaA